MRLLNLVIVFLCFAVNVFGQNVNPGPCITALGMTGVALQEEWSLQSNQAGLAAIDRPTVAFACQANYINSGIYTQTALFSCPYHVNVFGVSFQNYGFEAYKLQRVGLAYARSFGNKLFASLDFNIHQLTIDRYGTARTWSVEGGVQYKLSKAVTIGAHVSNPSSNGFELNLNEEIPVVYELGASVRVSSNVLLNSGIQKIPRAEDDIRGGVEYRPTDIIAIRGGISCHPFVQYAGFGFYYRSFYLNSAVSFHPMLGYSPQISIGYEF